MSTADGSATERPNPLRLLFGLTLPVGRRQYLLWGFALMALKYALDSVAVFSATGRLYSPLRFLSPVIAWRLPEPAQQVSVHADEIALLAMTVWALVFMWVGVSMSVRRAADAGLSPWIGLLFLVPVVNLLAITALAIPPSKPGQRRAPVYVYRAPPEPQQPELLPEQLRATLLGVGSALAIAATMIALSVYVLGVYGAALFFLTPVMMGTTTAYIYNSRRVHSLPKTLGLSLVPVAVTAAALLLLALEGLICILMAAPIAVVLSLLGALLGWAIASGSRDVAGAHAVIAVLALPLLAGAETKLTAPETYEVVTTIEIAAPPEKVWPNVIGFSELPPPSEAVFATGVAYPQRARMVGTGPGAVRHCEFSTGAFVEPITRWEPPRRLSFDVAKQPPAMKEWSPFANVYPPHLDHSIRSKRGEFRLVPLPGGRTRLEGSTWYELRMAPPAYWQVWSNLLIHSIHERVLSHIKTLSE